MASNSPPLEPKDELDEILEVLPWRGKCGHFSDEPCSCPEWRGWEDMPKLKQALQFYVEKQRIDFGTGIVGEIDRVKADWLGRGGEGHKDYWRGFSDLAFHLDEYIGKKLAERTPKLESEEL